MPPCSLLLLIALLVALLLIARGVWWGSGDKREKGKGAQPKIFPFRPPIHHHPQTTSHTLRPIAERSAELLPPAVALPALPARLATAFLDC